MVNSQLRLRRRWWWLALTPFVLLVAWLFWVIWTPDLPAGPVRLERDEAGDWADTENDSGIHGEAQLGRINSSTNTVSHLSRTSSDGDRFPCRSVAIFCRHDHLLLQRVGAAVTEKLRDWPGLDRLEYYPPGHSPVAGEPAPDLWVEIDASRVESTGVVGRRLEANLVVTVGSMLNRCRSHSSTRLDPPTVDFEAGTKLEHASDTLGVGTPSSRYKLAANDIAEKIAKQLADWRDDLKEDYAPLPELPEVLYPAYTATPDLGLGDVAPATSVRGLMTSNETLWRLELRQPFAKWLTELDERLTEAGFTRAKYDFDLKSMPHLRATRGEEIVTAYPHEVWRGLPAEGEPTHAEVHYTRRLSLAKREAAYSEILDDEAAEEDLVRLIAKRGPQKLRERAKERLPENEQGGEP